MQHLRNISNLEWGTVCDDNLDINDAKVICKFLGFPDAIQAYRGAHFGEGSGLIWLNNLHCNGHEIQPFECSHLGLGIHNCKHSKDAGVKCTRKSCQMNSMHCLFVT